MAINHIFLDMDGVLTDFVGAALRIHGRSDILESWPPGERDAPKVLGLSRGKFWNAIDAQGSDFWAGLDPLPWFGELIEMVRAVAPFTVLTAPSLAPSSTKGKVRWMYQHFANDKGRRFTDFLIGPQKHLLAQSGHLLIDDTDATVDAFRIDGGRAILFPQVWNSNHGVGDPIEYIGDELRKIQSA